MTKRGKQIVGALLIILGLVAGGRTYYRAVIAGPSDEAPDQAAAVVGSVPFPASMPTGAALGTLKEPAPAPARLAIPSLDIDAPVVEVGRTEAGSMAAPKGFTNVGWYKYGARPGDLGSAVMAGHVDNGLKRAGVFKRLKDVEIGSEIVVSGADGATRRFVVTDKRYFDFASEPPQDVFDAADGKAHLNLITCEGVWIPEKKTYGQRLVVFAELAA